MHTTIYYIGSRTRQPDTTTGRIIHTHSRSHMFSLFPCRASRSRLIYDIRTYIHNYKCTQVLIPSCTPTTTADKTGVYIRHTVTECTRAPQYTEYSTFVCARIDRKLCENLSEFWTLECPLNILRKVSCVATTKSIYYIITFVFTIEIGQGIVRVNKHSTYTFQCTDVCTKHNKYLKKNTIFSSSALCNS